MQVQSRNTQPITQVESLGQSLKNVTSGVQKTMRKAKLIKAAKPEKKNDIIVVAIPTTFVKTEILQSPKKLNFTAVVGKDFNIPVGGFQNNIVVYVVEVRNAHGDCWKLERTFADFQQLHSRIKSKFPAVTKIITSFPKRNLFSTQLTPEQVEFRQKFFQAYLQALLQLKPRLSYVNDFLEVHKHTEAPKKRELSIDDFELLKLLGKGSFGMVFLVRVLGSSDLYAMKVLRKSEVKKRKQIEHTKTELRVMGSAEHPFICTLRFAFTTDTRLFMVSDFCQGGELFFHLKTMKHFTLPMVQFYSAEISLALNYLHEHFIIYRDIKPENVLLDDVGHIKLTDFGLSRDNIHEDDEATTFCGTPEYLSPEMLVGRQKGRGYGKSVDWWGLGVLVYEMFFGWPPFYDKNKKNMCRKILKAKLAFKGPNAASLTPAAKDLIAGLLQRNPERRLGMAGEGFEELKQHLFFQSIDWAKLLRREVEPPFKPKLSKTTDNFDREFTDQSARISEHEQGNAEPELEDDEDEGADVFEDFNFTRPIADDFWEIQG